MSHYAKAPGSEPEHLAELSVSAKKPPQKIWTKRWHSGDLDDPGLIPDFDEAEPEEASGWVRQRR